MLVFKRCERLQLLPATPGTSMEQFRNIGIIGRLAAPVLDTIRRLKRFLVERHLHVILEENIAEVLPGTACRHRRGSDWANPATG